MMKPVEQSLYPKLSPIYNKILQLVSAILLIIVLMSIWLSTVDKQQQVIDKHFQQTSRQFLQQTIAGVSVLLDEQKLPMTKKSRHSLLQTYFNSLAKPEFIRDIHLYDATGVLLFSSENTQHSSLSIKALYGVDNSHKTIDKSHQYVPFIGEIRHKQLEGYLRITVEKSELTSTLSQEADNIQALVRMLLIMAGVIGFLLTRGLNRFSRQGYRVPTESVTKSH